MELKTKVSVRDVDNLKEEENGLDWDGVFRFSNPTEEDFEFFWNGKQYIYPAQQRVPMIIADETLMNIQEIRKRAAKKLAIREFYKGKEYARLAKMGNGLPPIYDEKILEPVIQQCLAPLPIGKAKVKEMPKDDERNFKASKAISEKENLNYAFKDEPISTKGVMPSVEL